MNSQYGSNGESVRPNIGRRVGKIYKQYYRKAWEEIPEFKEWLTSIPGERSKAYCKICERSLHAHRLSLTKHTLSMKHTRLAQRKAQQRNLNLTECYEADVSADGQTQVEMDQTTYSVIGTHHLLKQDYSSEVITGDVITSTAPLNDHELNQLRAQQEEEEEETDEMVIAGSGDETSHTQIIYTTEDGENIIYEAAEEHRTSTAATNSTPEGENHLSLVQLVSPKKDIPDKPSGRVTTHVIDISKGMPVSGLAISLYQLLDGRWILLSEGTSDGDGRWGEGGNVRMKPGRYKLHYDTERYFLLRHQPTFYPFVEVVFDMCSPSDSYHLPLILGPHGFTTYKGC